jgi:hypothetical protein
MEIDTAEPLVPEPRPFDVDFAIAKLKEHKSPDIDQITAEFIQAGRETLQSEMLKLIDSIWNKKELPET